MLNKKLLFLVDLDKKGFPQFNLSKAKFSTDFRPVIGSYQNISLTGGKTASSANGPYYSTSTNYPAYPKIEVIPLDSSGKGKGAVIELITEKSQSNFHWDWNAGGDNGTEHRYAAVSYVTIEGFKIIKPGSGYRQPKLVIKFPVAYYFKSNRLISYTVTTTFTPK